MLLFALALAGCEALRAPSQGQLGVQLDAAIQALASAGEDERVRAAENYRRLLVRNLSRFLADAPGRPPVALDPGTGGIDSPPVFTDFEPVRRTRVTRPALHRTGLGLPMVARVAPGDPNAPLGGYRVALTLVALPYGPQRDCCEVALVDPQRFQAVRTVHGDLPLAMNLEAPLVATSSTGPGRLFGIANLLRPGGFVSRPRITALQPFDPGKIPVVLVHGLMSTSRLWEPVVLNLLADPEIRARCQFWFFYYPTGKPVPLSALYLREALDSALSAHDVQHPMILIGHSMGGILSRVQVSRMTLEDARIMVPEAASLPENSVIRRALVFEPRTDIARVVFLFTPHRGSLLASGGLGAWAIKLIRIPDTLLTELGLGAEELSALRGNRLPTSIHSLSPHSLFLGALDRRPPTVPTHSVIGDRGRGDGPVGSDGVVPYASAHLASAESELVVPTDHSGVAHPQTLAELRRIIHLTLAGRPPEGFTTEAAVWAPAVR